MTTITAGAPTECSLAVLSTRLGQQDEQSAKDRHWIDKLSQQLNDTTTQFAHISKVLECLLTSHTPMATLVDTPAVPSITVGLVLSLWGQHPHLSSNKAPPPARSISLPTVSMSMGRQPHTAMQRFSRIKQVLSKHRPEECLEPLCQAILPLRFLDPVSSRPGCSHARPTSSPESATTPTCYNHCDCQGPHSTTPWMAPFTATSDQVWLPFWPQGLLHFTDNYQCNQHGHRHSHHGQSDPQHASEATTENHTRWVYRPFGASPSRFLVQICLHRL